jgi:hypothetical protein
MTNNRKLDGQHAAVTASLGEVISPPFVVKGYLTRSSVLHGGYDD